MYLNLKTIVLPYQTAQSTCCSFQCPDQTDIVLRFKQSESEETGLAARSKCVLENLEIIKYKLQNWFGECTLSTNSEQKYVLKLGYNCTIT